MKKKINHELLEKKIRAKLPENVEPRFSLSFRSGWRAEYGYAFASVSAERYDAGELTCEYRNEGSDAEVAQAQGLHHSAKLEDFATHIASVLATGRTIECGPGIGIRSWSFDVHGEGVDHGWPFLVSLVKGERRRRSDTEPEPAWVLNPDYQRPGVWDDERAARFIGHVLQGGEQPLIYVQRSRTYEGECEVIDGQQRLRAITNFVEGRIPAKVWLDDVGEWRTFWYEETNETERRTMGPMRSRIVFVDLPRADRLRFYLRLNSGVPHTDEELDRVRAMLVEERRRK